MLLKIRKIESSKSQKERMIDLVYGFGWEILLASIDDKIRYLKNSFDSKFIELVFSLSH